MAISQVVIISLYLLLIIHHIDSNSAEQYNIQKKITYHDDGNNGTMACIHLPNVQIRSYKTVPLELDNFRKFLRKKEKKRYSRKMKTLNPWKRVSKRNRRGKRFNPFAGLLPHLPWIPKISGLPTIGLPRKIQMSGISKLNNLIQPHILSGDKPLSWTYNDGNTSINVNYNPSRKSKSINLGTKSPRI